MIHYTKISEKTYYQRNKKVILNKVKEYYDRSKELLREKQEINIDNYQINKRIYRENMEEIDIKICVKRINKD